MLKKIKFVYQVDRVDGEILFENDQCVEFFNKRILNYENGFEEKELIVSGENYVKDYVGMVDKESDEAVGINISVFFDGSLDDEFLLDVFFFS